MLGPAKDPYPESPNVADEPGDGVKIGGEKPDDCDSTGDCSKKTSDIGTKGKASYYKETISSRPKEVSRFQLTVLVSAPVFRSTVA